MRRAGGIPRAGIVHRLDKDTSGLLVVAKTLTAQTDLVRQLQARTVKRHYLALALGTVERDGTVDAPLGRHAVQRTKMAVVRSGGKEARTHYAVRERFAKCTLLECRLETGRTHQIRVHLASIKHPLAGDPTYGRAKSGDARLDAFRARPCMPGAWRCAIRWAARDGTGSRPCRTTSRNCWNPCVPEFIVPDWPAPPGVRACRRRAAAVSAARPGGLQSRRPRRRRSAAVAANRRACCRRELPEEPCWLSQVHGTRCVDAALASGGEQADASFTRQRGVVCAVLTADCLPVLLCDERRDRGRRRPCRLARSGRRRDRGHRGGDGRAGQNA
jgi:hypothetical protein